MASDVWMALQWWGTLFFVGAAAWPLTKKLFAGWWDEGYFFSKAVGMAGASWIVYALGTMRLMPFSLPSTVTALTVVFLLGIAFHQGRKGRRGGWGKAVLTVIRGEACFLAALLGWSWVKAHEPSIRSLEKFMDYGFMQSILNSSYFPPQDPWYAGAPINYYYFGHLVTAVLTKLSGLDLAYTFNLMLATLFALTLTMSFSIGYQLMDSKQKAVSSGILTAFLVTMAGNMQTIYAFTRGYTGEDVKPFWELAWPLGDLARRLPEGMRAYWYANATRFIPFTIHEFPSYSFVVSDVHGHVLSIPFVLLAIAMLIKSKHEARSSKQTQNPNTQSSKRLGLRVLDGDRISDLFFYGFLVGVLVMTNALDGPIYFALLGAALGASHFPFPISPWKKAGLPLASVAVAATLASLPFLSHFKPFVSGLAVNCPPRFLAHTRIGPLLFEGVEKCQVSPLWMWWLLWGFFVYCGGVFLFNQYKSHARNSDYNRTEKLLIIFFLFALGLVIFPELFYMKDIYPAHFRSNTMFKLGYQAFILFSIVAGYTIVKLFRKKLFLLLLIPQLFLVSIYPIFSIRSYFGGLKRYEGIEGLGWMKREYADDWQAIEWLKRQTAKGKRQTEEGKKALTSLPFTFYRLPFDRLSIVEADGDSYTDYGRFSAFTGIPAIIGWPVHEWLWRGSYDVVAPRREQVRLVYESDDMEATRAILARYGVRYIIVGKLEREKYANLHEWKFAHLAREVFRSGRTVVYERY